MRSAFYLPDFCATRTVFVIVLIAQLVALILTLAGGDRDLDFWIEHGRNAAFLLWVALGTIFVLCAVRSQLAKLSIARASALALALMVAVTVWIS